jgi:anti-sigma B factor antagonist
VRVIGEVDLRTSPELQATLKTEMESGRHVLLDLSHVEFMDSTGIGVLIGAIQSARENDWDFAVSRQLSPTVDRLVEISGLRPLLGTVAPD